MQNEIKMNNIKLFEHKKIRTLNNEAKRKWYFSVIDKVGLLSVSIDPQA